MNKEMLSQYKAVEKRLKESLSQRRYVAVVKAPPGSGKTHLLVGLVIHAMDKGMRVAVATQTNSQADEICRRLNLLKKKHYRLLSSQQNFGNEDTSLNTMVVQKVDQVLDRKCIVVSTASKWAWSGTGAGAEFSILFIEEAWQLKYYNFMTLGHVAPRFVFIGDPGQIPPTVTIDTSPWDTAPTPPHRAAPEIVLRNLNIQPEELPATWRLPADSAGLVRTFYDFDFGAIAKPGERKIAINPGKNRLLRKLARAFEGKTYCCLTIDDGREAPATSDYDEGVAKAIVQTIDTLLKCGARYNAGEGLKKLRVSDIGISATHRKMVNLLSSSLPNAYRDEIRVDTPERWQGLETKLFFAVHPLSGLSEPSGFDLDTGRLCVMASRHQAGLVIVSREGIQQTLEEYYPVSEQAPGLPDDVGRGRAMHWEFWKRLTAEPESNIGLKGH